MTRTTEPGRTGALVLALLVPTIRVIACLAGVLDRLGGGLARVGRPRSRPGATPTG